MATDLEEIPQASLPPQCSLTQAVANAAVSGPEERGAIYTRREVVDFILDLSGYTPDRLLYEYRLLEPSFGQGDFLLVVIERLLQSWKEHAKSTAPLDTLANSIKAVELHESSYEITRSLVLDMLQGAGLTESDSKELASCWLFRGDFLLFEAASDFDFVIGNPPYVRQELIPDVLMKEYRARYKTIYDRADLYIPFIENSLLLLAKNGTLGFICSDRWMKNRYGGPLRRMIAEEFHLQTYVDMVDTDAFHSDVIAYPAITIIGRAKTGNTRIAHKPSIDTDTLCALTKSFHLKKLPSDENRIKEIAGVTSGANPWILESSDQLSTLRRLERDYPTLEEVGCKVGIGVATGADKAFIGSFDELDVEADRKLPLAMTHDILQGKVNWRGRGIINPFAEGGGLVNLNDYPRLSAYLEERREQISGRHIAKKSPANWYRTIDRIYPALAAQEKLLIPDIKGDAHIVHENGRLYPHHNLYYITASEWDLKSLQTVLMSGIARLFVATYSTRMRGGYLRFQAQYLRRIRVPFWSEVSECLREQLKDAARRGDTDSCNEVVYALYGLSKKERAALGGNSA